MFKLSHQSPLFFTVALSGLLIGASAEAQTTTAPATTAPAKSTAAPPAAAPAPKAAVSAKEAKKEAKKTAPKKKLAKTATTQDKAPSECKGLEEKACRVKATACYWIAATTRKDGKEVKAYCRHKPSTAAKKPAEPVVKKAATTAPAAAPPPEAKKK